MPDLEGWEPVWRELRDKLYRFTLAAFKTVRRHYEAIPGNGTRIGELWRPLAAVITALEAGEAEIDVVRNMFMEAAQEGRHEPTGWEVTLLYVLKERAETETSEAFDMSAQDILSNMNIDGDKQPGNKWIGNALSQYSLFVSRQRKWENGKYLTVYTFNPIRLKEFCEIYLREPPNPTCSPVQDTETVYKSDGYN